MWPAGLSDSIIQAGDDAVGRGLRFGTEDAELMSQLTSKVRICNGAHELRVIVRLKSNILLACFVWLLSDAKLTKDVVQHILVADLARDLAEIMQTPADVECDQVSRNFIG